MNRRDFVLRSGAVCLAATVPHVSLAATDYTPGLVKKHLAAGDTVFLDFKASWCTTCKAQERVINTLNEANPEYEKNIVFVNVDWDDYAKADLTRALNIPRRSTLVALKGDQEIGRIVAGTSKKEIKALMDAALAAAQA